ncbi:MAG: HEAT repeat domain-containing protein [Planctomycetota bacterium]|jgi:HEAT repeat protein
MGMQKAFLHFALFTVGCLSGISSGQTEEKKFDDLVEKLKADDFEVRMEAVYGLAKFGERSIDVLIEALTDEDEDVCFAVVKSLSMIGIPAIPKLVALRSRKDLSDIVPTVLGKMGGEALPHLGNFAEDLAALTEDEDVVLRRAAISAVVTIGSVSKSIVTRVVAALQDEDGKVKKTSATYIATHGRYAAQHVPALVRALDDPDPEVHVGVAIGLGQMGPLAKAAVPKLVQILKESSKEFASPTPNEISLAIAGIGFAAIEALDAALESATPRARYWVVFTLGRIGPETVHQLVKVIRDKEPKGRKEALEFLVKSGPSAFPAIGALLDILKTEEGELHELARKVLIGIGEIAIPDVLDLMRSGDASLRDDAVRILGALGSRGWPAVPSLLPLLAHEDRDVREKAGWILSRIGERAAPSLIKMLDIENPEVRMGAVRALRDMGWNAKSAVLRLNRIAEDEKEREAIREACREAIREIESGNVPRAAGKFGDRPQEADRTRFKDLRKSLKSFAREYEKEYAGRFGLKVKENPPEFVLLIFQTTDELKDFLEKSRYRRIHPPPALYISGADTICIALGDDPRPEITGNFVHELVHHLNHHYFSVMDPWIDEGLAMLLQIDYMQRAMNIMSDSSVQERFKKYMNEVMKRLPHVPLKELISKSNEHWGYNMEKESDKNYMKALAVVYYLRQKFPNTFFTNCREYMRIRRTEKTGLGYPPRAFMKAFKMPVYKVEEELKAFYGK